MTDRQIDDDRQIERQTACNDRQDDRQTETDRQTMTDRQTCIYNCISFFWPEYGSLIQCAQVNGI